MPAVPESVSSSTGLLPSIWPQKNIYELLLGESPLLGIIKKDTGFAENVRNIAVGYAGNQSMSSTLATAKDNAVANKSVQFGISAKSHYGVFHLEGRLMRMAKAGGNMAVLIDPLKRSSENLMKQAKRNFSAWLHGNGGGAFGRMTATSNPATATITLTNAADIRRFEPGMWLQTATTDGASGTVKPGKVQLASVGTEDSPTLTATGNWTAGIATAAASDYIFLDGTFGAVFSGFDAWNPYWLGGSPAAFAGVTRTVSPERLAGIPVNCTTFGSTREAIKRLARRVKDAGGKPDLCAMSTRQFEAFTNALESQGNIVWNKVPSAPVGKVNFGIAYDAVQVMGPSGMIDVLPDAEMPDDTIRVFTKDTWTLASTGPLFQWIEGAGGGKGLSGLMMENSLDEYEGRLVSDCELYCEAPGYNAVGRVVVPT
jgi:hypothetical protein